VVEKILDTYELDKLFQDTLKRVDPPVKQLFLKGKTEIMSSSATKVGIIGTKTPTKQGSSLAYDLAYILAKDNNTIISGCAPGIDKQAHQGALDAGGHTIAVLPSGYNQVSYTDTEEIQEQVSIHGLLVSEYPPNTISLQPNYQQRDRIQALLADIVIMVESEINGGAMRTIDYANALNKKILVIAFQESATSRKGNEILISNGVTHIVPEDVKIIQQLI